MTASSSTYDTDPVGEILEQPSFLNACVAVSTELEPLALLDAVKELEARLGREAAAPRHGPRAIDIDILLLGSERIENERMTLPHEQLLTRRFVLIPALELDFELAPPAAIAWRTRWAPWRRGGGALGRATPGPAQRLTLAGPLRSGGSGRARSSADDDPPAHPLGCVDRAAVAEGPGAVEADGVGALAHRAGMRSR